MKKNAKFYDQRLRELIGELGLPLKCLPDILELSSENCLSWWSQKKSIPLKLEHFQRLESLVGISENSLRSGVYDLELARKRVSDNSLILPERYCTNQNSFLRTSFHIIKYLILTRGQSFADQILYNMNVSPLIYSNLDTKVNLTYFMDLLDTLSKAGLSNLEMDSLSSVMFLSMHETKIGQIIGQGNNAHDVYSLLSKNFEYFDTNFEYKSKFIGNSYILETELPLSKHTILAQAHESTLRLMRYRQILLAWFPYLTGGTPIFPSTSLEIKSDRILASYSFNLSNSIKPQVQLQLV